MAESDLIKIYIFLFRVLMYMTSEMIWECFRIKTEQLKISIDDSSSHTSVFVMTKRWLGLNFINYKIMKNRMSIVKRYL